MDPRIPPVLHPLLEDYTSLIEKDLPGRVSGAYLVGSIALGEFNPRMSDIDLVAVMGAKPTGSDYEQVKNIHTSIEAKYPVWKFEGLYFQTGDLGCRDNEVGAYLDFHDGRLAWPQHFGLSAITWWTLKHCGIPVFGPSIDSLPITVDQRYLLQTQIENLNSYWASWTRRVDGLLALLSDWGVQWTVLGVLRQFFTLREGELTSKVAAGRYGLAHLPERWASIVREAIRLREDSPRSLYRSRIRRAADAYGFLRYILRTCNDEYEHIQDID